MSSPTATATAAPAALRRWLSRRRFWLVLGLAAILAGVVYVVLQDDAPERYATDSPRLDGYGAMVEVLEDRGTDVVTVRSGVAALQALEDDPDAMLVVHEGNRPANPETLDDLVSEDRPTVWISPNSALGLPELDGVSRYAVGADLAVGAPLSAGSRCAHPAAEAAESVPPPVELFSLEGSSAEALCFETEDASEAYAMIETDHGIVLGTPAAFTNREIVEEGGAALALHLFGAEDRVVWYSPAQWDVGPTGDQGVEDPTDLLPEWFGLLAVWLLVCTGLFIVVAGRRHGPVVSESLPVLVPASESAEGRGRMYQQSDAIVPSARTLRAAALVRSARLLRLGAADEQVVVEAAARQTGRPAQQVRRLLDVDGLRSNRDLVAFARRIADFEDELRVRAGLTRRSEQILGEDASTDHGAPPRDRRSGTSPEDGASRD
ncbi:DUF4350 domain-containing protein [Nesterenkonia marinintestina]|uniref:DUF4350 domain-containing protein n=1 Tax=Nesterenkonia marinintestina TaxID=2979865 RepID=UPI0021BF2991|nr:DUF4350 domain-containing protein [Nesterenkonia sp. GX14115]